LAELAAVIFQKIAACKNGYGSCKNMVDLEVEIATQKTNRRSLVHDAATLVIRKDI
jgi:hypothetical protein